MACPVIIILTPDQLVMVATGAQLEFRRSDGLQESSPPIPIWKPSIFSMCLLPRAADGDGWFPSVVVGVAADVELEVAAPLVWAIIQSRVPQRRPFSLGKTYGVYMSTMADPSG